MFSWMLCSQHESNRYVAWVAPPVPLPRHSFYAYSYSFGRTKWLRLDTTFTWWHSNKNHKHPIFNTNYKTNMFIYGPCQEFDYLEFYAGAANLSKCMASAHYNTRSFDVLYHEQPPTRKSNFMNLCHASGFGFLVKSIYCVLDNPPMNAYGLVYEEVSTTVLSGLMSSIKTGPTPFRMIYPIFFRPL